MIEPVLPQEPEGVRPRAIWGVATGVVVLGAVLVAIAWWLVVPPSASERAAQASPLEHGLIEHASGGADVRAAGEAELQRTVWIDRRAGVVRIPIDRAIDAVVANPALIGAQPSTIHGAIPGATSTAPTAAIPRPTAGANPPAIRGSNSGATPTVPSDAISRATSGANPPAIHGSNSGAIPTAPTAASLREAPASNPPEGNPPWIPGEVAR